MEINAEIQEQQSSVAIMLRCEESSSRLTSLEKALHQMVSNSVKELCFEYKKQNNNPSPEDASRPKLFVSIQRPDEADNEYLALAVVDERKQLGRKIKNHVTGEKVVSFDVPEDFDVEGIQNIEEIKDRLGKWRIQRRQRDSNMNDTYYCHLASRQTCRSVPEVLDFMIYGTKHKRSASDVASTSQGDKALSKMPWKKQRRNKNQNLEENCGPEEKFGTLEEAMQELAHVELDGVDDDHDHFHYGVHFFMDDPVNYLLDYDCGPADKFSTLEEAKKKLAHVKLEGVNDENDHFQHGIHFSKPDPVNHLLDYDYDYYDDDVIDVLLG